MSGDDGTLFARLGGTAAIEAVTAEFYRRALADPLLAPHFAGADIGRLAGMLAAFLSMALGGPGAYQGADLRVAHRHLALGDREFDRVVSLLGEVLADAGAGGVLINEVAAVAESVRGDVLGR